MKTINNGAYVTMITPYDDNGIVDYGAVYALAEWYCYNNVDGIFASCQSSEIWRLGLSDRIKITETTVRAVENYYAKTGRKVSVVASGHVSWSEEEQVADLCGQLDAFAFPLAFPLGITRKAFRPCRSLYRLQLAVLLRPL